MPQQDNCNLLPDGENFFFEMGPIRPPSEGNDHSLLLRITRNCHWNRCVFCATYQGKKFSYRKFPEIKHDIGVARALHDELLSLAGGRQGITPEMLRVLWVRNPRLPGGSPEHQTLKWQNLHNVANWHNSGARTVFLQDADALIMRTPDLLAILHYLRETFPSVERVTAYARSKSCLRKSPEELAALRQAGLVRLHVGLESGCDEVLARMQKGVSTREQVAAGQKVAAAGISLCEYFMPGLGGREFSGKHARDSAGALSAIDPDFIRLRTLALRRNSPLLAQAKEGRFTELPEDEVVAEIALLVEHLHCRSYLVSDQMSNLLYGVEGQLPRDKEKILGVIRDYLHKPEPERQAFRLRQRWRSYLAVYGVLPEPLEQLVQEAWDALGREAPDARERVDRAIAALKEGFV